MELNKRNSYIWLGKSIIVELFKVSLITYLLFYLIDSFFHGVISGFINLSTLLIITIIAGVIALSVSDPHTDKEDIRKNYMNTVFVILLSIVVAVLVYVQIRDIGRFSYIIALLAGILTTLLSSLFIKISTKQDD